MKQIQLTSKQGQVEVNQLEDGDVIPIEPVEMILLTDDESELENVILMPNGDDLLIIFADGSVITLADYFVVGRVNGYLPQLTIGDTVVVSAEYTYDPDETSWQLEIENFTLINLRDFFDVEERDIGGGVGELIRDLAGNGNSGGNDVLRGTILDDDRVILVSNESPLLSSILESPGSDREARLEDDGLAASASLDGPGGEASALAAAEGGNRAPEAKDDAVSTSEKSPMNLNLVGNDLDADGDMLAITHVNGTTLTVGTPLTLSSGATVTLQSNGTIDYDPNGQFDSVADGSTGSDSFTYTISDGKGGTDTATVNVTVNGVNDAPDAVNDSVTTDQDSSVNVAVLSNDSDIDGDSLTVTLADGTALTVGSPVTLSSGATVTLQSNGAIDYDPNGQFDSVAAGSTDSDSFTYTISDGKGGTDTATVNVTVNGVNDAPDAVNDSVTTDQDSSVNVAVLSNDSDIDGDSLTVTLADGTALTVGTPLTLSSGATVTLQSNGTIDYDPNGQFDSVADGSTGSDSFTYTISDGKGGTDTATVNVTVNGVNDAPDAVNDSVTTDQNSSVNVAVLSNDNDIDGDSLTVTLADGTTLTVGTSLTLSSGATVTLQSNGTIDYDPNGQFDSVAAGSTDRDSFTYTISDGKGGTDTATVNVTINGVNDAPEAVNDSVTTDQDSSVNVTVLSNDSDIDGDSLTVTLADGTALTVGSPVTLSSGATVTLQSNGTIDYDPNGQFDSVADGSTGSDSFTYTISDGKGGTDTATVNVTINGVNDAPEAVNDSVTTDQDSSVNVAVLSNDSDIDGDSLTVTLADGTALTVGTPVTLSSGATVTLQANGTIDYDPNGQFDSVADGSTGSDSFTYTISDGKGGTDTATVNVTVNGVNDAPDAVNDSVTTDQNNSVNVAVLSNDSDIDGDSLTVTLADGSALTVGSPVTLSSGATVTLQSNGTIDYDPNGQFDSVADGSTDSDSFTYTISDGKGGTDTATVNVTVNGVNDAPDAVNDLVTTDQDSSVNVAVLSNDSDVDGDSLTVTLADGTTLTVGTPLTLSSGATVTLQAKGTIDYDPNGQFDSVGRRLNRKRLVHLLPLAMARVAPTRPPSTSPSTA